MGTTGQLENGPPTLERNFWPMWPSNWGKWREDPLVVGVKIWSHHWWFSLHTTSRFDRDSPWEKSASTWYAVTLPANCPTPLLKSHHLVWSGCPIPAAIRFDPCPITSVLAQRQEAQSCADGPWFDLGSGQASYLFIRGRQIDARGVWEDESLNWYIGCSSPPILALPSPRPIRIQCLYDCHMKSNVWVIPRTELINVGHFILYP